MKRFTTFALRPIVQTEKGPQCECGPKCKDIGKHPGEAWGKIELRDPPLIPTATQGVGIATGARSGIFVVDTDMKPGIDGEAELAKLGPLPVTRTVRTPTGGRHRCFNHPGFPVRNSGPKSNPIAPGVDIRGDGGYVVAPGSPHKNGGIYVVEVDAPIVDAPDWLLAWAGLRRADDVVSIPPADIESEVSYVPKDWRVAKAKEWLATQPPAISGAGGSGHTMNVLSRAVRCCCLTDVDMVLEAIEDWNARCVPPWDGPQLSHKISEAFTKSRYRWNMGISMEFEMGASPIPDSRNSEPEFSESKPGKLSPRWGKWDEILPEPVFVVSPLFPECSVSMFVAHGDSAKTWTAISVGAAVARGVPWLNRYSVLAGKVLILDYESNDYEIRRRMRILGVTHAPDLGYQDHPPLRIDDPELWAELATMGLRLVIVDSLSAGAFGVDENDAKAAVPLQLAKKFAAETGCVVLFIHHRRKGEGDARELVRGTSAFFAALDACFSFKPVDESEARKRMRLECIKMRTGKKPGAINVELTDGGLVWFEDDVRKAAADGSPAALQDAIKLVVGGKKILTQKELSKALGKKHAEVIEQLEVLMKAGEIRMIPREGYVLDSDELRRTRVLEAIDRGTRGKAPELAKTAGVLRKDVEELEREGVIVWSFDGRFIKAG